MAQFQSFASLSFRQEASLGRDGDEQSCLTFLIHELARSAKQAPKNHMLLQVKYELTGMCPMFLSLSAGFNGSFSVVRSGVKVHFVLTSASSESSNIIGSITHSAPLPTHSHSAE